MLRDNPYKSTLLDKTQNVGDRIVTVLWWLGYLHLPIALMLIYGCWILTTASLGRPPRFGELTESDAAYKVVHVMAISAALLIFASPILIPVALVWGFTQPFAQRPLRNATVTKRFACLSTYMAMGALVATVYFFDPFGAVVWFWD
jgi:hypothetical protein